MARFVATYEPAVERHEHHEAYGPAGEPGLPVGDPLVKELQAEAAAVVDVVVVTPVVVAVASDVTPEQAKAAEAAAAAATRADELSTLKTWTSPEGVEVAYFEGDLGGRLDITAAVKQVETPGFLWRVEDEETRFAQTGFAATAEQAVADARAWVTSQVAAPGVPLVVATPIDLSDILAFAGIEVDAEPKG